MSKYLYGEFLSDGNNLLNTRMGPITIEEFSSDKQKRIHDELYNEAKNKFIQDHLSSDNINNDGYVYEEGDIIMEIPDDYGYYYPSDIYIIKSEVGEDGKITFTKNRYSLGSYWNFYEYDRKNEKNYIFPLTKKTSTEDNELIYLDYLKGNAIIENRVDDKKYNLDFNYINDETLISEKMLKGVKIK